MRRRNWIMRQVDGLMALRASIRRTENTDNAYAEAALERHKRRGMRLAVRARWTAMILIALMLPMIAPWPELIWYEALCLGFGLIGRAQERVAEVGRSRREFLLLLLDLALLTVVLALPNPFAPAEMPTAMQFRTFGFIYFFLFLSLATLAYSWRTVWMTGVVISGFWSLAALGVWLFGAVDPALTREVEELFGAGSPMARILDPNSIRYEVRVQEIVVVLLVAAILATTSRRSRVLLLEQAAVARERANLARYFSPNVVEELSHNDQPLRLVRRQNIAVMFVDICDFTAFAAQRESEEVIETLRAFHQRMEAEVFRHQGTLDKYLGDGLMATFGTPVSGPCDATNAMKCARAMLASLDEWNAARRAEGEPELDAGIGLHYGEAVLGDIGSNRLEFAVIGTTVNIASRVEALTRKLDARLIVTDVLRERLDHETGRDLLEGLVRREGVRLHGIDEPVTVWLLPKTGPGGSAAGP